jgi:hypothetical protein
MINRRNVNTPISGDFRKNASCVKPTYLYISINFKIMAKTHLN